MLRTVPRLLRVGLAVALLAAAQGSAGSDALRLVDVHGHLQKAMSAEDLVRLMDEHGVSKMVLMATGGPPGGTDEQSLAYARKYPGRFIPFVGFQNRPMLQGALTWNYPPPIALSFLDYVERRLESGEFFGLGEIMLRYHGHAVEAPEVDHPAASPLMFRIADLATRYGVPMLIHAEGEPHVASGMKRLLEAYPGTPLIWAHNCGRQSAEAIARALESHANLYCDLGGMTYTRTFGYGAGWPHYKSGTIPIEDGFGRLRDEMKALFERFPDRFMVGMDVYYFQAYQYYPERVRRFRELLSQLSPAAARRIAHENAERLFARAAASR